MITQNYLTSSTNHSFFEDSSAEDSDNYGGAFTTQSRRDSIASNDSFEGLIFKSITREIDSKHSSTDNVT
jgi:hypothetical protein